MAKTITRFVCTECGRTAPKYMGKCPKCGAFNSMVEEIVREETSATSHSPLQRLTGRSTPRRLPQIDIQAEERIHVPIGEFARVLGGGIVPGSIVLIGGDPGIGKSTLLLQMTMGMANQQRVLYVSGEESERQIKMRATRLQAQNRSETGAVAPLPDELFLVTETNLGVMMEHVREVKPTLLIVDSIQTTYIPELSSSAGSVTQVRECASQLRACWSISWTRCCIWRATVINLIGFCAR